MSRTIDEINLSIARSIINKLPEHWMEASINAEMYGDSAEFQGKYKSMQSDGQFKVDHSALDDFEELQSLMIQEGQDKWNRAKFTLAPSGEFHIDFEWDQELADEIERLNR